MAILCFACSQVRHACKNWHMSGMVWGGMGWSGWQEKETSKSILLEGFGFLYVLRSCFFSPFVFAIFFFSSFFGYHFNEHRVCNNEKTNKLPLLHLILYQSSKLLIQLKPKSHPVLLPDPHRHLLPNERAKLLMPPPLPPSLFLIPDIHRKKPITVKLPLNTGQ